MELIEAHIKGEINANSQAECNVYQELIRNLNKNIDSKYNYWLNVPITELGVPSKKVYMQDYKEQYIKFVEDRCQIDRDYAIELMNMVKEPVRTSALLLDIGKMLNDELIAGLEINGKQHYEIPSNYQDVEKFAKQLFADMIKNIEVNKIAPLKTANSCYQSNRGPCSTEYFNYVKTLREFTHEL
jgi:hypothetical protein